MAAKRIDDYTTDFTYSKAGKVVSTARVVVSKDGKTATVRSKGTNAEGKKFDSRAVYDKQ